MYMFIQLELHAKKFPKTYIQFKLKYNADIFGNAHQWVVHQKSVLYELILSLHPI